MKKVTNLICSVIVLPILLIMGCSNSYISSNSSRTRSNSYSHTEDNNNISLKFTKFNKEMEKAVPIKNVKKDMEFKYSDYSLSEGSIVFQIGTEDNEIVFQKEINPKDGEEGTIKVENLLTEKRYFCKVIGKNALEGSIKIKW